MLKLIVVDDFEVEREEALEIIRDAGLEIEITGQAANGRDALELIDIDVPDVALIDVEMPIMDGLVLADILKQRYPDIKVIFFSVYDRFEYVKKAIDVSSYGYILKPVISEELVNVLERAISEKMNELDRKKEYNELKAMVEKSKPVLAEKFLAGLFNGVYKTEDLIWDTMNYLGVKINKGRYGVCILEVDDYEELIKRMNVEDRQLLAMDIFKTVDLIQSPFCLKVISKIDEIHYAILFSYSSSFSQNQINEDIYELASQLLRAIHAKSLSVSIGVSEIGDKILGINELCEQCLYALKFKFNLGKSQIINIRDVESKDILVGNFKLDIHNMQKDLRYIINSGDEKAGEVYIRELFGKLSMESLEQHNVKNFCYSVIVCLQLDLQEINETIDNVLGKDASIWEKLFRFETIKDITQWITNILKFTISYVNEKNLNNNRKIIKQIQDYIQNNYVLDINIKSIANEFFYSPNYINSLFKKETGSTIADYILQVKMEIAKKMLKDPKLKFYEVSESVGYINEAYFRKKFKECVGLSPREYRESR